MDVSGETVVWEGKELGRVQLLRGGMVGLWREEPFQGVHLGTGQAFQRVATGTKAGPSAHARVRDWGKAESGASMPFLAVT